MRLKFALLFLILVVYSFAYNPVKSNDKDKALADNSKKVKVKKAELTAAQDEDDEGSKSLDEVEEDAGIDDDEQDDDEDVKEVPKKKSHVKQKKSKKPPAKKDKTRKSKKNDQEITEELKDEIEEEDDSNEYQACNADTSPDNELCHCDVHEIDCSEITMESGDPYLRTLDVAIMKKDFEPITAKFTKNKISRLQNDKVLPKFEKFVSILDVSYNEIRFIDNDVFKPFTNLTKLYLSHNVLQTVKKDVFDAAKNTLHRLDLGYNRIKVVSDNSFDTLSKLKVLSLDGNPIKAWRKEMFKGLDSLEELSLDNCNIENLPADIFEYLPKLVKLSLRENPLEEIPAVVAHLKSLKDIDLSVTNLTEIRDHAFAGDSDLEEIILEKMPFLTVVRDCGFCGLPQLKTLILNDNKYLQELHPNAFGYIKSQPGHKSAAITSLQIHNSNISTISEHMVDYDNLKTFQVGGNPWNCNCDTQFMLEEKFAFKQDSVAPKCTSPAGLNGRLLVTVRASDACEDARFLGRSGRSVLGLALLVGFIAIGTYYMVSSGKLERLVRRVRKEPEVTYTNLQNAGEDFALETDFQPRPAEV
ncbi:LRRCT domain-containing protein [Caenorhabditis elegans]|uniref:LRRCT domain-containing protein n=1 Tax=Caenorhabditis elegans TaxID=6239 RepID=H2L0D5_CAEEL|nr:LRRCT domain-containing protein [Caenorhabditis elegans]CCD72543.1 LRRCT domain-containing protein [Caenorhabditis elegans]|eukprot:NP_001123160.1 eLRR (extracellular Leucine-Rich Repeat) ONly [Caenorhabditis elegans]